MEQISGFWRANALNAPPNQGPVRDIHSNDYANVPNTPLLNQGPARDSYTSSQTTGDGENIAEEQPLESHEVIVLQSFIERKAWIEQKTEFLEKLPPVEAFAGLDAVRASAETVPGLPSREQLKQWMEEHDALEKETDILDQGELQKLRQWTKAATQRNLSPADTDLIEITLTAIYALDKLLHLLRDRSENFELLSLRLDWEESRIAVWSDRRNIVEDLRTFLQTRASWNPSVYDNALLPPEDMHTLTQRDPPAPSTAGASDSTLSSAQLSRSSRWEILSRDAALYSARITVLRHGKIAAAGKVLDKLIDRRTVPDELLDEQDRLEEKGINDLEHIGKFIMGVVMQWRKADEIYVETLKDKTAAQDLAEEIEVAKTNHPTARQSATYASRADTLLKRLALRGNPSSPVSAFPCPENSLYEEQVERNKSLVDYLSAEIASATEIVKKVDIQAKEYCTNYDAIKQVETLVSDAKGLTTSMKALQARLQQDVLIDEGHDEDESPPDFTSKQRLEPSRRSAFIALLPSMLTEYCKVSAQASQTIRDSGPAMLQLNFIGIDPTFIKNAKQAFRDLSSEDRYLQKVSDGVTNQLDALVALLPSMLTEYCEISAKTSLINDAILKFINSNDHKDIDKVLGLRDNDAVALMDLLQTILETNAGISASSHRNAHKLLVRLCESSGTLPSSLKVQGVQLIDQNAIYGGGFADIYKASYQGQDVALKRLRVFQHGSEPHKIHREFCKEALLWKRLRHPHLLPFIGIDSATFAPLLCMVSPWMDCGTLTGYVRKHPDVNAEELLLQAADALDYLHCNSIVHGDLRGGNILINSKGEASLADFGLTRIVEATTVTHTSNAAGSTRWMAPELHDPESFGFPHFVRTTASDVYAFACVCLEVYTGASPFSKIVSDSMVTLKVIQGKRPERPTETRRPLSDNVWGMITNAWAQQPSDRPPISTIAEILRITRVEP